MQDILHTCRTVSFAHPFPSLKTHTGRKQEVKEYEEISALFGLLPRLKRGGGSITISEPLWSLTMLWTSCYLLPALPPETKIEPRLSDYIGECDFISLGANNKMDLSIGTSEPLILTTRLPFVAKHQQARESLWRGSHLPSGDRYTVLACSLSQLAPERKSRCVTLGRKEGKHN